MRRISVDRVATGVLSKRLDRWPSGVRTLGPQCARHHRTPRCINSSGPRDRSFLGTSGTVPTGGSGLKGHTIGVARTMRHASRETHSWVGSAYRDVESRCMSSPIAASVRVARRARATPPARTQKGLRPPEPKKGSARQNPRGRVDSDGRKPCFRTAETSEGRHARLRAALAIWRSCGCSDRRVSKSRFRETSQS